MDAINFDHPPGGKDDLANAVAGVLVFLASARYQPAKTYIGTWGNPTGLPKPTKFPDGPITDPDYLLFGGTPYLRLDFEKGKLDNARETTWTNDPAAQCAR